MNDTSALDELVEIAARLGEVGADVAAARMKRGGDPFATTSAYAALLAARVDVAACLDGPPPPTGDEPGDVDIAGLINQLGELFESLSRYAQTHTGTVSLACARAALYVDDARVHLANDAS